MSFGGLRGRSQKHVGLFVLVEPAEEPAIVDIIAVHGLSGDAFSTWEANGKSWLRDFLPRQLPGCRVMTFGYVASVGIREPMGSLIEIAKPLLESLQLERQSAPNRPIIFVAHSLGGIIVKEAILLASGLGSQYSDVLDSINGVVFMGTPHRGIRSGSWMKPLSRILRLPGVPFELTDRDPPSFAAISEQFAGRNPGMRFVNIYEAQGFPNIPIVDRASAVLGLPNETTIQLPVSHTDLARFSSENSLEYRTVAAAVLNLYKSAVENMSSSVRMASRSGITRPPDTKIWTHMWQAGELFQASTWTSYNVSLAAFENWLRELNPLYKALALDNCREGEARVKIAVIDAKFEFNRYNGQDSGARDTFVRGPQHYVGYGAVRQARLISRVAPAAECYIGQVSRDSSDTTGTRFEEDVAQAISHAVFNWRVDIIYLGFALSYESAVIRDALLRVSMRGALLFAGAWHSKLSGFPSFPGNQEDVIGICTADRGERALHPRSSTANHGPNFTVLAEQIPVRSDRPGEEKWVSGSFLATAAATGIAANILKVARHGPHSRSRNPLSEHEINHLHCTEGMASVLKTISQESDETLLLIPRELLTLGHSPREVTEAFQSALIAALNLTSVYRPETSGLDWDAESSISAYSGTNLTKYQLSIAEESIARFLFNDPVLNSLYRPALIRLGYLSFQGHFERILCSHAERLDAEANSVTEKQCASLLKSRARAIAQAIVNPISLIGTEKVAAMERLKDQKPFPDDSFWKYIADLSNVPQLQAQPATLAKADPNLKDLPGGGGVPAMGIQCIHKLTFKQN